MTSPPPQSLVVGRDRRRIACLVQPGDGSAHLPGLLWLPGFKSEMVSTKASVLADWGAAHGRGVVRFDYSGHGQSALDQSGGRFEDGTIGRWLEEVRAVFAGLTRGPQIVVGSSMGGYLALLLARRLMLEHPAEAARIKALVLIAPAWNMTEVLWARMPDAARRELMETGVWQRPSQYGSAYPITRGLIDDGRRHLLASRGWNRGWNPGRPVVILHGRLDPDVPFGHSEELCRVLDGSWTRLVAVADGEHRLSRPDDIALLLRLIDAAA